LSTVILFCNESPGTSMKLGPGDIKDGRVIVFDRGYAELDDTAPDFALRMSWVNTPGCPHIEVMTEAERPAPFNPNDLACPATVTSEENLTGSRHIVRSQVPCTFRAPTEQEIHGHLLAVHAPKKVEG